MRLRPHLLVAHSFGVDYIQYGSRYLARDPVNRALTHVRLSPLTTRRKSSAHTKHERVVLTLQTRTGERNADTKKTGEEIVCLLCDLQNQSPSYHLDHKYKHNSLKSTTQPLVGLLIEHGRLDRRIG